MSYQEAIDTYVRIGVIGNIRNRDGQGYNTLLSSENSKLSGHCDKCTKIKSICNPNPGWHQKPSNDRQYITSHGGKSPIDSGHFIVINRTVGDD